MPKNIFQTPYDLVSPDGKIQSICDKRENSLVCRIVIENISPNFKGFSIDESLTVFQLRSTLTQLGICGYGKDYVYDKKFFRVECLLSLMAENPLGKQVIRHLETGSYVGKLFAKDDRRLVRKVDYLQRLLGKTDEEQDPLLILGEEYKSEKITEENGRTIAYIPVIEGFFQYDEHIAGFIPTLTLGLKNPKANFRQFLSLHQKKQEQQSPLLLVKTQNIYIQTLFGSIVKEKLPKEYQKICSDIISPGKETHAIFSVYVQNPQPISHAPLEFYTLEPYREYFTFSDKDLLQKSLTNPENMFQAFSTCPPSRCAAYIIKNDQLQNLKLQDWMLSSPVSEDPLVIPPKTRIEKQTLKNHIEADSIYPILQAMQHGDITSEGVILCKYFPSPLLKRFFLNHRVTRCLQGVYFEIPSQKHGDFFSHDDRSMLLDLARSEVDVFWIDSSSKLLLKYVLRGDKNSGMFVPISKEQDFINAVFFGVYGSRLTTTCHRQEIFLLFQGLLDMKQELQHMKCNPQVPFALSTGGGPGYMAMGNSIASELGMLSCGHVVDFTKPHEQSDTPLEEMNPYVQAKMTYRLEQLIIRQSEFRLDYPIFLEGGFGTDLEYALEILQTQVGNRDLGPILLFGSPDYWEKKITSCFQINRIKETIRGSEWVSNTLFCVQNHQQALSVYYKHFTNRLHIGKNEPPLDRGFHIYENI